MFTTSNWCAQLLTDFATFILTHITLTDAHNFELTCITSNWREWHLKKKRKSVGSVNSAGSRNHTAENMFFIRSNLDYKTLFPRFFSTRHVFALFFLAFVDQTSSKTHFLPKKVQDAVSCWKTKTHFCYTVYRYKLRPNNLHHRTTLNNYFFSCSEKQTPWNTGFS
jgi:hypothetical protein